MSGLRPRIRNDQRKLNEQRDARSVHERALAFDAESRNADTSMDPSIFLSGSTSMREAVERRKVAGMIVTLVSACVMSVAGAAEIAASSAEEEPAIATHPNPLLGIDQNRNTVIDRVVGDWGEALEATRTGIDRTHLRTLLEGLRADQLLAASLAGSLEGLRNVIANALTTSAPVAPSLVRAKVLGDATDDLAYTPITPCRIVDSRFSTGGALQAGQVRNWLAANPGGNFGAQGGAASNCGIPIKPAAVVINFTVANTTGAANFLTAWPFNVARPTASTLNWTAPGQQIANAVIVRLCSGGGCTSDFSTYASAPTDLIGDVLGYFAAPAGAVSGSGAANSLAKWGAGGNTLGTSAVFEKNGLVGIGTAAPAFALDVAVPFSNTIINLVNGVNTAAARIARYTNRLEISPDDALQVSVGGVANPHFWVGASGNVGIGNTAPVNHLQIGSAPGFSGNDLAIGNGAKGMSFFQSGTASNWYSSTNFALMPNTGNGYVGIGTQSPANRLQVGSVGASDYSGYDIAFGNGGGASGFTQTGTFVRWDSNTNIALMPVNGTGGVGINTTSPVATLDVEGSVPAGDEFTYFKDNDTSLHHCVPCGAQVSIWASSNVMAKEFDAFSDVRIKNVAGVSESSRDLATLNALQVTDYTLKDVVRNGAKPFKKVIAQQVETVYPQVVSKHVDFIPNVYRTASRVTNEADGTLLHFDAGHGLSTEAKRLKLLASGERSMRRVNIVAIRSDQDVLIESSRLDGDQVFVYGEEVDDFRTVDYEGLTALNISATQELAKRAVQQSAEIAELRRQLATLMARMNALTTGNADATVSLPR
jgi:hypothetical protein